jgi:Fis family transcriptional regulator
MPFGTAPDPPGNDEAGTYHRPRAALHSASACPLIVSRQRNHGRKQVLPGKSAVVNAVAVRAEQASESTLQPALRECVARAVRRYLQDLDSHMPENMYTLVLEEVEKPLLREVLAWAGGNQSRAAAALGINRATLRKKLAQLRIG